MKKEMTPNRKIPVKILIGTGVYIVSYLLSIAIFYSLSGLFEYGNTFIGSASSLVAAVASFFTITKDERGALFYNHETCLINKKYILPYILFTILTAYSLTVVFNFLFSKIPWDVFGKNHIVQDNASFYGIPFYLRIIAYILIGPFAEEMLFRGVIFYRLRKVIVFPLAALGSAVFFALFHGNLMQGIYALFMGFTICLFMDMGGSFLYALLFHMAANLVSNLCYEFEYINNVVYSVPGIAICFAYLVVAIILCYVFKSKLTKKDKQC
ncbi:MAG: CPBP family intramembrane metalloprotease [Lachnospiraceae bacterium]|nr:CPBP family intramembrane metalloprotease [Lachnospiraceae bacterium]